MGSKSKLANRIVSLFPRADHFFDLFCGGSAVSHCTLLRGSYPHIHINDINPMMPEAFVKALQGGFDDEDRWISREDFFRLKDSDPYVAICFSFGNNLKTYCYGPDVEPIKKALHYAIFFDSYELSDELIGIDLRPIQKRAKRQEKYLLAKRLIKAAYAESTLPNIYCSKTGQDSGVCRLQSYERQVRIEDIAQKKTQHDSTFRIGKSSRDAKHYAAKLAEYAPTPNNYPPPTYNRWNRNLRMACSGSQVYQTPTRRASLAGVVPTTRP